MGNRSKKGYKKKKLQKKLAEQTALILSIPDACKTCNAAFDKKNREMAMTWYVEVFNAEKRVDLYCPECKPERE